MDVPSDIGLLSPSALVKLVLALVTENRALGAENEGLRLENVLLRGEIEGLKRALGSGASPYSSNRRKSPPKRPGRKAGEVAERLTAAVRRAPVVNTDDTG